MDGGEAPAIDKAGPDETSGSSVMPGGDIVDGKDVGGGSPADKTGGSAPEKEVGGQLHDHDDETHPDSEGVEEHDSDENGSVVSNGDVNGLKLVTAEVFKEGKLPSGETHKSIKGQHKLTAEELNAVGDQMVTSVRRIDELEEEKKENARDDKAGIEGEKKNLKRLCDQHRTGTRPRSYLCRLVKDFEAGKRRWIDLATDTEILAEDLLAEDYEKDLFEAEQENARRNQEAQVTDGQLETIERLCQECGFKEDVPHEAAIQRFGLPEETMLSDLTHQEAAILIKMLGSVVTIGIGVFKKLVFSALAAGYSHDHAATASAFLFENADYPALTKDEVCAHLDEVYRQDEEPDNPFREFSPVELKATPDLMEDLKRAAAEAGDEGTQMEDICMENYACDLVDITYADAENMLDYYRDLIETSSEDGSDEPEETREDSEVVEAD